jgi:hypothetical protein
LWGRDLFGVGINELRCVCTRDILDLGGIVVHGLLIGILRDIDGHQHLLKVCGGLLLCVAWVVSVQRLRNGDLLFGGISRLSLVCGGLLLCVAWDVGMLELPHRPVPVFHGFDGLC